MDSHGGVHEGIADWFATLGHPHLRVRGGYVCGSGLVPPVGLCKRVPKKYDFVNALQLCPPHRLVVIGHVLAELHRHLEAPRLRGVDLEDRCAAEDFAAPFLQDFCLDASFDVACDGCHHRVAHLLGVDGAQGTTLFRRAVRPLSRR